MIRGWIITALLFASVSLPLGAQSSDNGIAIHGFGGWSYGKTSHDNIYLGGSPEGNFRLSEFALNLAASPQKGLRIVAQSRWTEGDDGLAMALDYAFAEFKVSDKLRVRLGQVKQPFGIYTEVSAVGTLRPFYSLPQAIYGPVGFVGQAYKGLGVTGELVSASGWRLDYDVYAGGQDLLKGPVPERFYHGDPLDSVEDEIELLSTRNVLGGRTVFHTPINGLSFGVSAYTGTLNEEASNQRSIGALQAEYLSDRWSVRSEIAHMNQVDDETATGYYIESAYRFATRWQGALQYGHLANSFFGIDASVSPSFERHAEYGAGLNFWLSNSLVIKASGAIIEGNRFAFPHPENIYDLVAAGALKRSTGLLRFGGQYSF